MTDLLNKIYGLQQSNELKLGVIQTKLNAIDKNCRICQAHYHQMAQTTAIHASDISRHSRKISEMFERINVTENTGVKHITEIKAERKTVKGMLIFAAGFIGALVGLLTIYNFLR